MGHPHWNRGSQKNLMLEPVAAPWRVGLKGRRAHVSTALLMVN